MQERTKVFTHVTGHGTTVIEPPLEDNLNAWLATAKGKLVQVSQSESERTGVGHHITITVWYLPEEETGSPNNGAPS